MGIPIVVGVTGHRLIRREDVPALRARVREALRALMARYPSSPLVLLDSIAIGGDTLCALEALELGIPLVCPLPMPAEEYRRDFSGEDAQTFDALLRQASESFAVPVPPGADRDTCYRQAGVYVAEHSHVLLALWDGAPGTPEGCGAADVVACLLRGGGEGDPFKAANDGAVLHVLTPRQGDPASTDHPVRLLENQPGSLAEILARTDAFNARAAALEEDSDQEDALLPPPLWDRPGPLRELHRLYQAANRLSLLAQKKYLRAMKWFSVFGVLLVVFFLLYDELEADLFLLCYGGLLLVYVAAFLLERRRGSLEKYLQYRMLSETLRTQFYLSAAGVEENIGAAFTWTQKQEAAWIKEAISALRADTPSGTAADAGAVKAAWIDGQLAYHRRACLRTTRQRRGSERAAGWMLAASIALFAAVFVLEFRFTGAMTAVLWEGPLPALLLHHPGQEFTLRSLLKIVLGGVAAVTAFLANYYGKLSLERKSVDHEKMAALYQSAKERFESGQCGHAQLFRLLAREEIIENGNWFSYCRENPPAFNV